MLIQVRKLTVIEFVIDLHKERGKWCQFSLKSANSSCFLIPELFAYVPIPCTYNTYNNSVFKRWIIVK